MDVKAQVKVGILGGGTMAAVHAASLCTSEWGQLVGVAAKEVSPEVTALARRLDAPIMGVDELLASSRLDAVIVATPTDTHTDLACRALRTGLDVFCEKPIVRTPEEGRVIAEAAEAAGAKVAVGHVVRYFPEYSEARDLVQSGALGRPAMARLARVNGSPAALRPWYGLADRSGGVLVDMGVHDIDWCLWALGPVVRICAKRTGEAAREVASVTMRHRSGAISYIDLSWRAAGFSTSLEVAGTEALFQADGSSSAGVVVDLDDGGARETDVSYLSSLTTGHPPLDDPYRLELEAALEWFGGGKPPLAVLEDGLAAARVVAAAEESARSGRPVTLDAEVS
ncbi:MAG: Gfo/Idh/MocA family protein [Acidimicrobiales bacterium]